MKIAIIEDDDILRKMVRKYIESKKYEVLENRSSVEGLEMIKREKPDIVILDIILPEIDGFSVCQIIRKYPDKYGNPFVMMLTSKHEEKDVVKGFSCGADDYLKKPFSYAELQARIDSVIKRKERDRSKAYVYKNIVIDIEKDTVLDTDTGEGVELFRKEFEILVYLIQNTGIVLTRENIYEAVWKTEFLQGDRAIDNYIWKLKAKLPVLDEKLKSIRGMGYKLEK